MKKTIFLFLAFLLIFQGGKVLRAEAEQPTQVEARKRFNKLSKGTPQIYKVTMRSNVVFKLQTALGYVSTIDLPESALKVFIGDQELFKVGVYEREVLVKPITEYKDARTNLTIITQSGRLTFDVTVGPPETADFVLDFRLPEDDVLVENAFTRAVQEKSTQLVKEFEKKAAGLDEKAKALAGKKVKEEVAQGTEMIELRKNEETGDIRLNLISLSRIGGKLYLRFGVRNLSSSPYKISRVVLGMEAYKRRTFGLRKEPHGMTEIASEWEMKNPVSPMDYSYGVLVFDARALGKEERPIFLLFEEGGTRNIKIRDFRWIS